MRITVQAELFRYRLCENFIINLDDNSIYWNCEL